MRGTQDFSPSQLIARRMDTGMQSKIGKTDRLIQGHPMFHPVGQLIDHHFDIIRKPIGRIPIQPPALVIERQRIIPGKQRHVGLNSDGEQIINELVIECQPLGIDLAGPSGNHSRPSDREPVGVGAQRFHQGHVGFRAVVMVARFRAGVTAPDCARFAAKHIPNRLPATVRLGSAFDLIGGRRNTPDKVLWKTHRPSTSLSQVRAISMCPAGLGCTPSPAQYSGGACFTAASNIDWNGTNFVANSPASFLTTTRR